MATIGTFTKQDGSFVGSLTTLTVKSKVTISPIDKTSDKAPDFRVYGGAAEIGAAWSATHRCLKRHGLGVGGDGRCLLRGEAGGHAELPAP